MMTKDQAITDPDGMRKSHHWLPPCRFLGPLSSRIASLRFRSSLTEHQAIVRFTNQYGLKISENNINEGLYFVSILHFLGPNDEDYDLAYDAPIPEMTCFNSREVVSLSEVVARWERPT